MNQDIQNYIQQQRSAGLSDDQIKANLRSSGWTDANINVAFPGGGSSALKIILIILAVFLILGAIGSFILFSVIKKGINQLEENLEVLDEDNSYNYLNLEEEKDPDDYCDSFISAEEVNAITGNFYDSSEGISGAGFSAVGEGRFHRCFYMDGTDGFDQMVLSWILESGYRGLGPSESWTHVELEGIDEFYMQSGDRTNDARAVIDGYVVTIYTEWMDRQMMIDLFKKIYENRQTI